MEEAEVMIEELGPFAELAMNFAIDATGALAILIVGTWFAGKVRDYVRRGLDRTDRVEATLRPVIASIARYAILILILIAVLAQFGVETTSIIAVLGAAGLAIGLALQGTLQNIAAGFMLLFLRPFRAGDFIDAGGISGTVNEVGLFVSKLTSLDGLPLVVPNSSIWGSTITNYSGANQRRTDLPVGIGYGDDLKKAKAVLEELVSSDERVLKDPAPLIQVTELGDSAVVINLRYWTLASDLWATKCDMTEAVKLRLDEEGISIPFPQRDVHVIGSGLAAE